MADEDATKEALSILGLIRSGVVDLTGLVKGPGAEMMARGITASGPGGGGIEAQMTAERMRAFTGPQPSAPLGADDALPLTLGTAGEVLGRRLPIPGGGLVGGAIGAGAGRALNQPIYGLMGGTAPSPTGNRLMDVMLEMGGQTAGNLLGMGTAKTAGVAASAVTPTPDPAAMATRRAFGETGVNLNVADVAPSMAAGERSIAQTATGGRRIREAADARAGQLQKAADEWLGRLAPAEARERMAVGEKVSDSVAAHVTRTGALDDVLWTQMGQLANDVPVRLDNLKAFANNALLSEKRGKHPNGKMIEFLEGILNDTDTWAWQAADATRKQYGREIGGQRALISDVPLGAYQGAYGAIMRDMEASAASSGVTGLGPAFANVRAFSERRREIFRDGEVAKILETDPEQVVKMLRLAGGPSAIKRAREAVLGSPELGLATPKPADTEAWNYVRRHVMEGVFQKATNPEYKGLANPVIVGKRLDDALKTIGKDGLEELLSETERKALDNLVIVAKKLRESERIGALPGTSTTPQGLNYLDLLRAPGAYVGAGLGFLGGGLPGAAAGAGAGGLASMILVPHVAARMLTSPNLAKIVASPSFATLADLTGKGATGLKEANMLVGRLLGEMTAETLGGRQP